MDSPVRQKRMNLIMMRFRLLPLVVSIATVSILQLEPVEAQSKNPAVTPQARIEEWWFARHTENIGQMSKGDIDLLMVGDSITQNFESIGVKVWNRHFKPYKAINLGFGGDRTNHLLWRLDHLPLLKKSPKGAVVLIGTNNICWGSDTPKQAAEGVQAVAQKLHNLYPKMRILVQGVLPRRRQLDHPHRKQINELNSYLPALLKDIPHVTFLDIGPKFLDEKGFLSKEMMPDTTHPSERGHEIWAAAIESELKKMLALTEQELIEIVQLNWIPAGGAAPPRSTLGEATTITIKNTRAQMVKLYWVEYEGALLHYADIAAGATLKRGTFSDATWVITDEKEKPLGHFIATVKPSQVDIPK